MEVPLSRATGPSQKQAEAAAATKSPRALADAAGCDTTVLAPKNPRPTGVGGHRPFPRALAYARSLQLRCRSEWQAWCTGETRPLDIPQQPEAVYADAGWQSYEHWLAPAFVKAHYGRPNGGLEVQGNDGGWRAVTTYDHATAGNVVLWYGSDEFAGIGGTIRWADAAKEILRDAEGAVIKTRPSVFAPLDAAVAFARALGLTTSEQWASWAKSGARTYPSSNQRV